MCPRLYRISARHGPLSKRYFFARRAYGFLGQVESVASDHVLRLQEPSTKPTTDRMEGVAGSILLRLRQKYRLISID